MSVFSRCLYLILFLPKACADSVLIPPASPQWTQEWTQGGIKHSVRVSPKGKGHWGATPTFAGSEDIVFLLEPTAGATAPAWYHTYVRGKDSGVLLRAMVLGNQGKRGSYDIFIKAGSLPSGTYNLLLQLDRYAPVWRPGADELSLDLNFTTNGSQWSVSDDGTMDGWCRRIRDNLTTTCIDQVMPQMCDGIHVLGSFIVKKVDKRTVPVLPICHVDVDVSPMSIGGSFYSGDDCDHDRQNAKGRSPCCEYTKDTFSSINRTSLMVLNHDEMIGYREAHCCYMIPTRREVFDFSKKVKITFIGDSTQRYLSRYTRDLGRLNNRFPKSGVPISGIDAYKPTNWGLANFDEKNADIGGARAQLQRAIRDFDIIVFTSCTHDLAVYNKNDPVHTPDYKPNIVGAFKQNLETAVATMKKLIAEAKTPKRIIFTSCLPQSYSKNHSYWPNTFIPKCFSHTFQGFTTRAMKITKQVVEREGWEYVDFFSMMSTALGRRDWVGHAEIHFNLEPDSEFIEKLRAKLIIAHIMLKKPR